MVAVLDIAYVRFGVPDLARMQGFLEDFGLQPVHRTATALYSRGAGTAPFVHVSEWSAEPATLGFGLYAQSADDLAAIAKEFGSPVEASPEPGGGSRVRLRDPAGFQVDVIHGQVPVAAQPVRDPIPLNPAVGRKRIGGTVRTRPAPSTIVRLGHVALLVRDYRASMAFYERLGFRSSDSYYAGERANLVASFMHCGLGERYTDHHTVAVITSPDGGIRFDHVAFEVLDIDDVMQGNAHLASKGYEHAWGVGRHIQGSQIFDYWRDPFGHKHEHWTDGDLVNDTMPAGVAAITNDELSQWAPAVTPAFFR